MIIDVARRPKILNFMAYGDYLKTISTKFENLIAEISTGYNFDYGEEFEIALCKVFRVLLPSKFGICRGFVVTADGKQAEGKHTLVEVVAYDIKGNKIENQYFPIAGSTLTGKEVYKYDEKGNISEMTMLNPDGTLLSKEVYKYEFDFAGNWNKMTTSVAVVDSRGITFEPTEVTYRSIMYYLDENVVKMVQPGAAPSSQPVAPAATTTASAC